MQESSTILWNGGIIIDFKIRWGDRRNAGSNTDALGSMRRLQSSIPSIESSSCHNFIPLLPGYLCPQQGFVNCLCVFSYWIELNFEVCVVEYDLILVIALYILFENVLVSYNLEACGVIFPPFSWYVLALDRELFIWHVLWWMFIGPFCLYTHTRTLISDSFEKFAFDLHIINSPSG